MQTNAGREHKIDCGLEELGKIDLVAVHGAKNADYQEWKQAIKRYHYLGHGKLYGRQLRYLIKSSKYGLLGALSFSSAAWKLKCREQWIGWQEEDRKKNLDKVICNSRFLILPYVQVKNLASNILARSMRRVQADWNDRYRVKPLMVETFVESGRYKGTCYEAANFSKVGQTAGRGRQDRYNQRNKPVKAIYLYPLEACAKKLLGGEKRLENTKTDRALDWAQIEFASAKLGDERLNKRLLIIARDFYGAPTSNIPQASRNRAKAKAAYRFFGNQDVTMEKILGAHYEATKVRMAQEPIVLAVQDSTSLNYAGHPQTEGLGPIGTISKNIGLIVHDTMVFNLEGTPLGLLNVQCWAREPKDFGKAQARRELKTEDKESVKWLKSFAAAVSAREKCPGTKIISVGDREADIYDLFKLAEKNAGRAELLIRAQHNRQTVNEAGYVWDLLKASPIQGKQIIRIPRKGNKVAREAELTIRYSEVELKAPRHGLAKGSVKLWAIYAEEEKAPAGRTGLKWMLLTTLVINSFEAATEKLEWYSKRWGIEIYHRTLKSGCKIEDRQLGKAERIEGCLAVDMVIAWRIYYLTKLGREVPEIPCNVFFEEAEWKALVAYKTGNPIAPQQAPTLKAAARLVAEIGGFLGRKSDGEPGTETMWRGMQTLDGITIMWKIMNQKLASNSPPGFVQ